jgi:vitamin B12 transporter
MRHLRRFLYCAAAFPLAVGAQSRDTSAAARALAHDSTSSRIEPMVITATRVPTSWTKVTQPITVLDGETLRARGILTVADALRSVPGVSVARTGSYGGVSSVFIRGGESRYTKVLLDGVPVNNADGSFYFQNLPTENIERIEVLRGPGSAIYGSDAMAGVVQIFTKRGHGAPTVDASIQAGSYGARNGDIAVRGGGRLGSYSVGGSAGRTDGIYDFNNQYKSGSLSGAFTFTPDDATSVALDSRYMAGEYHFPTDGNGVPFDSTAFTSQHRLTVALDASRELVSGVRLHLIGTTNEGHDLSRHDETTTTGGTTTLEQTFEPAKSYRRGGEVRLAVTSFPAALVTVGGQFERNFQQSRNHVVTTTTPGGVTSTVTTRDNARDTRGAYGAVQGAPLSWLAYDASLRYDHHSDYKDVTTYHAGVNVALFPTTHLRVSYGTAFNAPSFDATQGSAYNDPNPALQPERARTLDAAIEQTLFDGRLRASVGAFDQHFSQLIQYVMPSSGPAYYDNLTEARSKGYEAELHAELLDGLVASASYTQTIAKVYKVPPGFLYATAGDALQRRPSHSGTLDVGYSRSGVGSVAVTATYVGKRPDMDYVAFVPVTLDSYTKVDVSGSVDLSRFTRQHLALTARVENATNTTYQNVFGFQTPGRALFVGLRLRMGR